MLGTVNSGGDTGSQHSVCRRAGTDTWSDRSHHTTDRLDHDSHLKTNVYQFSAVRRSNLEQDHPCSRLNFICVSICILRPVNSEQSVPLRPILSYLSFVRSSHHDVALEKVER